MAARKTKSGARQLIREMVGGEPYEYFPLGEHIVSAPGVCGGRPTFKYTRLEAAYILDLVAGGWSIEKVVQHYKASRLTAEAVSEAIELAKEALVRTAPSLPTAA